MGISRERRRMKKIKKQMLKRQLMACCQQSVTSEDGTKKKIKCTDELCKHRKHKKKRKHKRHSQEREAPDQPSTPKKETFVSELVVAETPRKAVEKKELQSMVVDNEDTEETMDSYSTADDPDFKDPVSSTKVTIDDPQSIN